MPPDDDFPSQITTTWIAQQEFPYNSLIDYIIHLLTEQGFEVTPPSDRITAAKPRISRFIIEFPSVKKRTGPNKKGEENARRERAEMYFFKGIRP